MSHYKADNPADQPLHDMMDDIEKLYQAVEKAGVSPKKILAVLVQMALIYEDEHPFLKGAVEQCLPVMRLARTIMIGGPPEKEPN